MFLPSTLRQQAQVLFFRSILLLSELLLHQDTLMDLFS
jgi:hypothetical protein